MATRTVSEILKAEATPEGQGVTVYRTIGRRGFFQMDPFLLLDEFVISADAKGAGFPDHPHRGFETMTYMLTGLMEHKDNAGNGGVIGPGAAQWMTAGKGVIHSEMPKPDPNSPKDNIHGMQLWINLSSSEKMKAPQYQDIEASDVPVVNVGKASTVKVIAGMFDGVKGPVSGISLNPVYLDVAAAKGDALSIPVEYDHTVFLYLLSGTLEIEGANQTVEERHIVLFSAGDTINLKAAKDARFVLVGAKALDEPIARYGPFVMNTREEIMQAIDDYNSGKFAKSA